MCELTVRTQEARWGTDKVAKAYLKANPEAIKKFERVPEDYMTPAAAKLVNENPEV